MNQLLKTINFLLFFLFFFLSINLYPQTLTGNKGSINLLTSFGLKSSASYYAVNGNNVIELIDSNRIENNIYTFDLRNFIFDLGVRYSISDELQFQFDVPINYSNLKEVFLKDTNVESTSFGRRRTRADLSYVLPENYQFRILYHLLKGKVNTFVSAGLIIPPCFKNGKQNNGDFLYFSSFQFPVGITSNFVLNDDWVEAGVAYFFRTDDFSDELKIHLEGGFSTVPDTKLIGMLDYLINIDNLDDNGIFNIRQNPFIENYLYLGAQFSIKLHKKIETSISYNVSILGKNSWSFGIFGFKADFSIN